MFPLKIVLLLQICFCFVTKETSGLDIQLTLTLNILNLRLIHICPKKLQLNKSNISDTVVPFLDVNLSISDDVISTKIYDKRDDFDIENVNFTLLNGTRPTSYDMYISQLMRFVRTSSQDSDCRMPNINRFTFKYMYLMLLQIK